MSTRKYQVQASVTRVTTYETQVGASSAIEAIVQAEKLISSSGVEEWKENGSETTEMKVLSATPLFEVPHVAWYFREKIGRPLADTDSPPRVGEDIPIDSPCGQDCVKAIDAARLLLDHVRAVFGTGYIEYVHVVDSVREVCLVYICG